MSTFLFIVGFLVNLVGGVFVLVAAFRKSTGWGLACIFIPFAALVFVVQNWEEARTGFLIGIGGAALLILGAVIAPSPVPGTDPATTTQSEEASAAPASYSPSTYTPPPTPPPPMAAPATATTEPPRRVLEQVYIDRKTGLYYPEKCKKRPDNVARVAKSVAVMQGYTPAPCR